MSESINIGSANSYLEGNEIDSKKIIPFVEDGVDINLNEEVFDINQATCNIDHLLNFNSKENEKIQNIDNITNSQELSKVDESKNFLRIITLG